MKLKDIIQVSNTLLGTNLSINLFNKTETDAQLLAEMAAKPLSTLISCANLVIDELGSEYLPLVYKQDMTADENGIIGYAQFSKPLIVVLRIKNDKGVRIKYRYRSGGVEVSQAGNYTVVYSYKEGEKGFFDNVEVGANRLTERIIAYGVASEYCLMQGLYDDASIWDKRYKDALAQATSKRKEVVMPAKPFV